MRSIAHISDLHFDHVDAAVLPRLTEAVIAAKPDVVVVSGDLTQRAKAHQFAAARAFLDTLPRPQVVVPGNHDVPLYNVVARFLHPLANYRRHITDDLEPFHSDDEIAVLGVNTARSLTFKDGRINREQVASSCSRLTPLPPQIVRCVVTHHPFALPDASDDSVVGRAHMAIEGFARCRVDIIMSGHLHTSHATNAIDHYNNTPHSALIVQAGTATSVRRRGEVNAFNLLRIARPEVHVDRIAWDDAKQAFAPAGTTSYILPDTPVAKAQGATGTGG